MIYLKKWYRLLVFIFLGISLISFVFSQGRSNVPRTPSKITKQPTKQPTKQLQSIKNSKLPQKFPVIFMGVELEQIIDFYQELTDTKVILDSGLGTATLTFFYPQKLEREEAVRFIEAALLMNGRGGVGREG